VEKYSSDTESNAPIETQGITLLSWIFGVCLFSFLYETLLPVTPHLTSLFPSTTGQNSEPLVWLMTGVAIGTLVGGTVSDRFGRRNTLLVALVIATLGSLVSFVLKENWSALISGRFLAGSGSGAALVLCRVALREECDISRQLLVSSYLSLSVALTTITSPLLGNWTFTAFGLRGLLLLNLASSGVVLLIALNGFKETQKIQRGQHGLAHLFSNVGLLLRDPHFLLVTGIVTLAWLIFVLLGASLPTLLQERFKFSRQGYAVSTAFAYLAYFAGIRTSRKILTNIDPYSQLTYATSMLVLMFGIVIFYVTQSEFSAWIFIGMVACIYVLLGLVLPLTQTLVMRDEYSNFGLVASLFYFTELLSGAMALLGFSGLQGDLLIRLVIACLFTATVLFVFSIGLAACARQKNCQRH